MKFARLQLYPRFAENSPFLLDSLDSYFLGGIDDMATWSDNIWNQTVTMLDHGTEYVQCRAVDMLSQCSCINLFIVSYTYRLGFVTLGAFHCA